MASGSNEGALLQKLLDSYSKPSFGHLPKREIDLLMLDVMVEAGRISENPSIDELCSELRVSRSRARSLLYDRDLRRLDAKQLDEMLAKALHGAVLQKQGDLFAIEIENPRLQDFARTRLREMHQLSDASFAPGLLRLSATGLAALLGSYISDKQAVKKALVAVGAPDTSIEGVIKGAMIALGRKLADEAGEELANNLGGFIKVLIGGSESSIKKTWRGVFGK